jgi:hypothetical protein
MCDETKFHEYFRLSQYVLRILLVKPQNGSYNQDIRCRKQSHKNSVNAANTPKSLVSLTLRANNTAPYHISDVSVTELRRNIVANDVGQHCTGTDVNRTELICV